MKEVKEFKTESKRLLDLMINSIYTNQEIFLRELLSNASDAVDKYHYLTLTNQDVPKRDKYKIHIEINKELRTITISDNGIGMTYDEINDNLGTIAKSGTLAFMEKLEKEKEGAGNPDLESIGQFGVGFYSAFMVARKVTVETKSYFDESAYLFTSEGSETYTVEQIKEANPGSKITLYLKTNTEDYDYDQYLSEYRIKQLVKKYSDYIRYPITMFVEKQKPALDENGDIIEGKYETEIVEETLNSMIPIWKKAKKDVTDELVNDFYMQKFSEYEEPLLYLMFNVEGNINYNALIFVPKTAPFNLNSNSYEKGLQLYSKGIFIMDKCKELLPDYLRFIKGIVDSNDLALNISREMLQQNKVLSQMAKNIEKKIINRLSSLMTDDFDKYNEFFEQYGINLKFGIYENYGAKKDLLQDLLIYETLNSDTKVSFKKYIENMLENQKAIYYVSAKSKEDVSAMPQMDLIKKHGYDVLILKDDIDEFIMKILGTYQDYNFKAINQDELDELLNDEEDQKIEEIKESKKDLLNALKTALKDLVKDVIISKRLTDSPVCLSAGEGISFEMEKVLAESADGEEIKADRILEINPYHDLFQALEEIYNENPDEINDIAWLLYNQALLIEGLKIENPVRFSDLLCKLIIKSK